MGVRSHYGGSRPDHTVSFDQILPWREQEFAAQSLTMVDSSMKKGSLFKDPLTSPISEALDFGVSQSKFPVRDDINSKIFVWKGDPWTLEVDAVVNSTNENLEVSESSSRLHVAAGPGLEEECTNLTAMLGPCRTGEARVTSAYDLPARRVIHTVGPKYNPKFETAAINSLCHCYRACLEGLLEYNLSSVATGCVYSEEKGFPRELAAHVALRSVRRFLERYGERISAVVFCTVAPGDSAIYKRLLQLYFPRSQGEEEEARRKLPEDTGDENGETSAAERRIRIAGSLTNGGVPGVTSFDRRADFPLPFFSGSTSSSSSSIPTCLPPLDPSFLSVAGDPDLLREERWRAADSCQEGWPWARLIGQEGLGGRAPTPAQQDSLNARALAEAGSAGGLDDISEMSVLYRGGRDSQGRPVMVLVGGHFLPRAMNLDRFLLHAVREFDAVMRKPFSLVYFHSHVRLPPVPNFGWMRKLMQVLGRPVGQNLEEVYAIHPSFGLRATVLGLQIFGDSPVWRRVKYVDRLLELFQNVPRQSLVIPEFVFHCDAEVNPRDVVGLESHRRNNSHLFHES